MAKFEQVGFSFDAEMCGLIFLNATDNPVTVTIQTKHSHQNVMTIQKGKSTICTEQLLLGMNMGAAIEKVIIWLQHEDLKLKLYGSHLSREIKLLICKKAEPLSLRNICLMEVDKTLDELPEDLPWTIKDDIKDTKTGYISTQVDRLDHTVFTRGDTVKWCLCNTNQFYQEMLVIPRKYRRLIGRNQRLLISWDEKTQVGETPTSEDPEGAAAAAATAAAAGTAGGGGPPPEGVYWRGSSKYTQT